MSYPLLSHAAFSDRLRFCAQEVGSIGKLATAAGLHRNTINGYLKSVEPDRATLIRLAQAAGKSPEWLATGNPAFETVNAEQNAPTTFTTNGLPVGFKERLNSLIREYEVSNRSPT
jgi:transcriptional regulator with XRE-family HTH domain